MFFIGQSGYIITLLLTAFLPLFMLVAKPGPAQQFMNLTPSGPVTSYFSEDHSSKSDTRQEHTHDAELKPVIQEELRLPPERNLKKRVFHHLCVFVAPPLLNKTNKAPPAG